MGGFISGARHAVAAQAITAQRFRFQRFPHPGVHASPHQPREGLKSASRWRADVAGSGSHPPPLGDLGACRLSKSHHTRKLAPRRSRIPFAVLWWSQRPWPNKARWRDVPPALVPLFGVPSTRGARVGLEEDDGTDWIPGTALWVVADSSLRCTCAGLDCGEGDDPATVPRSERSGCSLYSGRKQTTVRKKQCQMSISPSEYFRLEFNQPSPRGLPLVDDQGMPFHPAAFLNVNGRDRGTVSRLLPISCCVRRAVEFWSACCDGR